MAFGGAGDAKVKLKTEVPELCYSCHKELRKNLSDPHVHKLFSEGKCTACHNAHVSRERGLLNDDIGTVCLNCHQTLQKLLKEAKIHAPVRSGVCTECHSAHSSRQKHLLKEGEKTLCLSCHTDLRDAEGLVFSCEPFRKGECSSCHRGHASGSANLLRSEPNSLCTECHAPRCRSAEGSIASLVRKSDCTECHSGHGSQYKGALGPYGHTDFLNGQCGQCHNPIAVGRPVTLRKQDAGLCLDCHEKDEPPVRMVSSDVHLKDAINPCIICHTTHASDEKNLTKHESIMCMDCHKKTEVKTKAMEKILRTPECPPVRDRRCFECHIPVHSDRPLNFRADDVETCTRCHTAEHSKTHPVGPDVTDPRNGKPVTCISCHSMHNAGADFMLTHDRNRALCIQCHRM